MFERFTERARQVVVLAQEEARILKHNYIGIERILLGLLSGEEGIAAYVFGGLRLNAEDVRSRVVAIVGSGTEVTSGQLPFTPRAKKVLELALREALLLSHNYIGTEHILLGLVRENNGVAARILLDVGADAETVRNEVIHTLAGRPARDQGPHSGGSASRTPCLMGPDRRFATSSISSSRASAARPTRVTCCSCLPQFPRESVSAPLQRLE